MLRRPVTGTRLPVIRVNIVGRSRLSGLVEIYQSYPYRCGLFIESNRASKQVIYVRTSECITVSARIGVRLRTRGYYPEHGRF